MKQLLLVLAVWLAFGTAAAQAKGTVTIVHSDGSQNVYNDAVIKIIHNALYVTSDDGDGTIVISRAACSYQDKLLVCLVTKATLVQDGSVTPLDFKSGTLYVNSTDDAQQLALSTTKIPAHSVLLSFTTDKGTYVGVSGRIDKVQ